MAQVSVIKEAARRVEQYQKENPLTVEEILNNSMVEYNESLMKRFIKEVEQERRKS